jgi:hypothetical protein
MTRKCRKRETVHTCGLFVPKRKEMQFSQS